MKADEAERAIRAIAKLTDYTLGYDLEAYLWIGSLAQSVVSGDTDKQIELYQRASRCEGEF